MIINTVDQDMPKSGRSTETSYFQYRILVAIEGQQQHIEKGSIQTYEIKIAHSLQTAKFPSESRELSWMMHLWERAIKHKKGYNSQHTKIQTLLRTYYPHEKQKSVKKQKIQQDEERKIFILITICKIRWYWQRILSSISAIPTGTSSCNTKEAKKGSQLVSSGTHRARQPNIYHLGTCCRQDRIGISSGAKASQAAAAAGEHGAAIGDLNKEFGKGRAKVNFREDILERIKNYDRDRWVQTDTMTVMTGIKTISKVTNGDNTCTRKMNQEMRLNLQFKVL
ncbi:hypothetical protein A4A49_57832, partial [Nicotiana attenuata]